MSRSKLRAELETIVDDEEELEQILDLLDKDFRNNVDDNSFEWAAGIGRDEEYQETYPGEEKIVYLSSKLGDAGRNKGILVFVHNHPVTSSPLASWEDYVLFANNKVEYGIITNEFGTLIIKNKNVEKSLLHKDNIGDIASEIQRKLTKDFQRRMKYLDNNFNQRWLSEEEYDEKFQEFAKEHHYKYLKKYQRKLEEYMDITFISA